MYRILLNGERRFREYFQIKNLRNNSNTIYAVYHKLNSISAMMCRKSIMSCEVDLAIDDKKYNFKGKSVTPEFIEIIESVFDSMVEYDENNKEIKLADQLTISIDLAATGMYDSYFEDVDPYETIDWYEHKENFDEVKDDVFYYTFIEDSGFECAGYLYAFGMLNNQEYNGCVNYKEYDGIPECINWYAPCTAMIYEMDDDCRKEISDEHLSKLTECCHKLMNFSRGDLLISNDETFEFDYNNLALRGKKDLEEFIPIAKEFCKLAEYTFDVEFLELGVNEPIVYNLLLDADDVRFEVKSL